MTNWYSQRRSAIRKRRSSDESSMPCSASSRIMAPVEETGLNARPGVRPNLILLVRVSRDDATTPETRKRAGTVMIECPALACFGFQNEIGAGAASAPGKGSIPLRFRIDTSRSSPRIISRTHRPPLRQRHRAGEAGFLTRVRCLWPWPPARSGRRRSAAPQ